MKLSLRLLLSLSLFFFLSSNYAQSNIPSIDNSYINYFQDSREVPYLHLNKTSFLHGEEIWFQAYILEQGSKKLHEKTSNLHVTIYNSDGTIKDSKLIYIEKGIGKGSILLDATYTQDKYYIKAATNWMRNFNEDQSFVQEITIIRSNKKTKEVKTLKEGDFFDFQVFPEGGHLLSGTVNQVGVLIKNKNGEGQKIEKGLVKNSKQEMVSTFSTNIMGIGSISYKHQEGEKYIIEATLQNGSTISKEMPKAKAYGVALNVFNPGTPVVNIFLNTNEATLPSLMGKKYMIWIHNTNAFYNVEMTFQPRNTSYSILLKKEKFAKGVNIITVFNEKNQPILERLIFNYDKTLFGDVSISSSRVKKDSIHVSFKNKNGKEKVFLSASFLPKTTKAYNPSYSLAGAFLLKPYIKGSIENVEYYFKNTNRKKLQELDKLLLTQGWSKYRWNNIFHRKNKHHFKFESGVTIKGTLPNILKKGERLLALSKENNLLTELKVQDKEFYFKNYLLQKNTAIGFAVETKKRLKSVNPYLQYSNTFIPEKLDITPYIKKDIKAELEISGFPSILKDRKLLDEIKITTKKVEYKNKPFGGVSILSGFKMSDRLNLDSETIADFLREKRFYIDKLGSSIATSRRGGAEINRGLGSSQGGSPPRFGGVRVFLDDNDITDSLWQLDDLFLSSVEEVFIGQLTDVWSDWQIYIYKKEFSTIVKRKNPFKNITLQQGFSKVKEYYQPKYPRYLNDTYLKYGTLFWKPTITLQNDKTYEFNIPENSQEHIVLFIEGISESGKIFSKKVVLSHKVY